MKMRVVWLSDAATIVSSFKLWCDVVSGKARTSGGCHGSGVKVSIAGTADEHTDTGTLHDFVKI